MFSELLDTHTIKVYDTNGVFISSYFYKKDGVIWVKNVELGECPHPRFGDNGADFDEWLIDMIKNFKFSVDIKANEIKA